METEPDGRQTAEDLPAPLPYTPEEETAIVQSIARRLVEERRQRDDILDRIRELTPHRLLTIKILFAWEKAEAEYRMPRRRRPVITLARMDTAAEFRLGRRIRITRVRAGVTQADLARAIGVSQPVLSRIETGLRPARHTELTAIEEALGRRVDPG